MNDFYSSDSSDLLRNAPSSMFIKSFMNFFDMTVSVDLQRNLYNVETKIKFLSERYSISGEYDDFVELTTSMIHPESRAKFIEEFARGGMYTSYYRGAASFSMECKFLGDDNYYHWVRVERLFVEAEGVDKIAIFIFFKMIDMEKKIEFENELVRKLFYLTADHSYEYIILIDKHSAIFETKYSNKDSLNTFPIFGDYENAVMLIRKQLIAEKEREDFYSSVNLSNVIKNIDSDGIFVYKFRTVIKNISSWHIAEYSYLSNGNSQVSLTISKEKD